MRTKNIITKCQMKWRGGIGDERGVEHGNRIYNNEMSI